MQQTPTYPNRPRRGLVIGLAISALLHMLLLAMLRTPSAPPAQPDSPRWAQPLTVTIVPPRPARAKPEPEPEPKQVARNAPRRKPARPDRPPAGPLRAPERAAPAQTDNAGQPAMTVVPAPSAEPAPADSAPRFDPDAARGAARAMANDLDPPSSNWVAEKLNKDKALKETKEARLGRNVANSARPDCRTAYAGAGLLAPLVMLMDKKDSGCKF